MIMMMMKMIRIEMTRTRIMIHRALSISLADNLGNGECKCTNNPGLPDERALGKTRVFSWRKQSVVGELLKGSVV